MRLTADEIVQDYLSKVCSRLKYREIHDQICDELKDHIQERVNDLQACQQVPREEAVQTALHDLGEPCLLGDDLARIHKPHINWSLLLIAVGLLALGMATLYTISLQAIDYMPTGLMLKSFIWLAIGLLLGGGAVWADYRKLQPLSKYLFMFMLVLPVGALATGTTHTGLPWVTIGPLSINLVTVALFGLTIGAAGIIAGLDMDRTPDQIKAAAVLYLPILVFAVCPSFFSAAIYGLVSIVLLFYRRMPLNKIAVLLLPLLLAGGVFMISEPYRLSRLTAFLFPGRDPQGAGYIFIQLRELLVSAGWWGQGLNFPAHLVPEIHTDFIFAYITYTFGWLAALMLLALAALLVIKMSAAIRQVKEPFGKLLVTAITVLIAVQFLVNILMNLGLAPLSAVSLPLISYGGSYLVLQMLALGLILGVYRRKDIVANKG